MATDREFPRIGRGAPSQFILSLRRAYGRQACFALDTAKSVAHCAAFVGPAAAFLAAGDPGAVNQ